MQSRPLLLDCFCGAGGCSMGYYRAGFDVVGVDMSPMKSYPAECEFIQMDAMETMRILLAGGSIRGGSLFSREYHLSDFAAVAGSPPCQAYCALKHMTTKEYPDLVAPFRELVTKTGLPYVIENVPGSPLAGRTVKDAEGAKYVIEIPAAHTSILCGTMFNLQTSCGAELRRHRLFETNWPLVIDLECDHGGLKRTIMAVGSSLRDRAARVDGRRTEDGVSRLKCPVISITGHTANDHAAIGERRRVITVDGKNPECSATGKRHCKGNRVISVHGDQPRDEGVRHDKRRTISISGHQAEVTGSEKVRSRTISVYGASPRDPGQEKARSRCITVTGSTPQQNVGRNQVHETFPTSAAREAMGTPWMSMKEMSQAIPPDYTEYIGRQLMAYLTGK